MDCAPYEPSQSSAQPASTPMVEQDVGSQQYMEEYGDDVYGRVLYDFKAESERDLDMAEGDTVTVLRKLNEHWFEARHDNGKVGLCPVSFVELIMSDPRPESPTKPLPRQSSLTQETTPTQSSATKHAYANVPTTPDIRSAENDLPSPTFPNRSDQSTTVASSPAVSSTPCDSKPADSPTPSSNRSKPRPVPKPKPQLKPKPTLSKNASVGSEPCKPTSQLNRMSMSIDSESTSRSVAQSNANKRLSMPVLSQHHPVLDSSLDDIIQNELMNC